MAANPFGLQPKKKTKADPLVTRAKANKTMLDNVLASGGQDPTKPKGPSALDRIFGVLDSLGTGGRALAHNALNNADDKDYDILGEMGKSLKGEKRVEGADLLKEHFNVQNKWGQMLGGMVLDILLDPLTYLSFGYGSATKVSALDDAARLAKEGVSAAKLADLGLDAGRYGDDIAKRLVGEGGSLLPQELSKEMSRDVMAAIRKQAGEALGDKGGIKFLGQTIAPAQAGMEKATGGLKDILRALPGAGFVERAVNPVAEVAMTGNEFATAAAKMLNKDLATGTNLAGQAAHEFGLNVFKNLDEQTRNLLPFAMDDAVAPFRAQAKPLYEELADLSAKLKVARGSKLESVMAELPALESRFGELGDELTRLTREVLEPTYLPSVNEALIKRGLTEEQAGTAVGFLADYVQPHFEKLLGLEKAIGIPESELLGKGAGSIGYAPRVKPGEKTFLENLLKRRTPTDAAITTEREALQRQIDLLRGGVDEVADAAQDAGMAAKEFIEFDKPFGWRRGADGWTGKGEFWGAWDEALKNDAAPDTLTAFDDLSEVFPSLWEAISDDNLDNAVDLVDTGIAFLTKKQAEFAGIAENTKAAFNPENNLIYVIPDNMSPWLGDDPLQAVLHEVQHAIDFKNGRVPDDLSDAWEILDGIATPSAQHEIDAEDFANRIVRALTPESARPENLGTRIVGGSAGRPADIAEGAATGGQENLSALLQKLSLLPESSANLKIPERVSGWGKSAGKPSQPGGRTFDTLVERLGAGYATETDIGLSGAQKTSDVLRNAAKARYEDDMLATFGKELGRDMGEAVTPLEGEVVHNITRNGKTIHYSIPKEIERQVASIGQLFTSDEATKSLLHGYDKVLNTWKRMATNWNPGFHGRNLMSNYVLSFTEGLHGGYGWAKAPQVMAGKASVVIDGVTMSADEILTEAKSVRAVVGDFVKNEVSRGVQQAIKEDSSIANLLKPSVGGARVGEWVEDTSRLAAYINARRKGLNPKAAGLMVDKALYDYSPEALTNIERNLGRRVVPFFVFMRRNIPHMLDVLVHDPGKLTWLGHLKESGEAANPVDESVMPEYMRDLFPIPTPLKDASGNTLLLNPNFPMQDLEKLNLVRDGKLDMKDALTSLSPAKILLELAVNKDFYFGENVSAYPGQTKRAPGYVQRFDDLVRGVPGISTAWDVFKDAFGIVRKAGDDGDYLAMNAYALKAVRDLSPWMNNVSKAMGDSERTPYDRLSVGAGVKLMPYDTEALAEQKTLNDSEALSNVVQRLTAEGKYRKAPKQVAKKKSIPFAPIAKGSGKKGDAFGLRPDMYQSLNAMNAEMQQAGLGALAVSSGKRSVAEQQKLRKQGVTQAAPKDSKHVGKDGTVSVVDLTTEGDHGLHPKQYLWMRQNAPRFGFSNPDETEPWHWEFGVGRGSGPKGDALSDALYGSTIPTAPYVPPMTATYSPYFNSRQTTMPKLSLSSVLMGQFQPIQTRQQQIESDPTYQGYVAMGGDTSFVSPYVGSGSATPDAPTDPKVLQSGGWEATETLKPHFGTPYSWGGGGKSGPSYGIGRGSGTKGFDCSGLTQHAAADNGFDIPRTAESQREFFKAKGWSVPASEMQPGDFLYFHTSRMGEGEAGHTAVYAGDGMMIEAPYTGGVVRRVSLGNYLRNHTLLGVGRLPLKPYATVAPAASVLGAKAYKPSPQLARSERNSGVPTKKSVPYLPKKVVGNSSNVGPYKGKLL